MSRHFGLPNPEAPTDGFHDWRDDPPTFWERYWRAMRPALKLAAILLAIVLVIAAWMLLLLPARAHVHDRPELDQWLMSLSSKHRGPCCDSTEAETMADPDWRNASEMKKGECEGQEVSDAVYCIRLEDPDRRGAWTWWAVPDDAVVEQPNKAGPALVWMYWERIDRGGLVTAKPFIRCFLPGTLS